jgi:hypothetical protein
MQEIMSHIVADVAEDAAAVDSGAGIPVVGEDDMSQLPKRSRQYHEEGRWHDQSVPVHRQVMMDTVEQEVEGDANTVIWQVPVTKR